MTHSKNKTEQWRGYSIDELRFQRALTKLRIEMEKERIQAAFSPHKSGKGLSVAGIVDTAGRYFDLAILGYTIFRRIAAILRRLRRH